MSTRIVESKKRGIRISADFIQSASQIWWQSLDDDPDDKESWHGTPYQVADARHREDEAITLIADWVDNQS